MDKQSHKSLSNRHKIKKIKRFSSPLKLTVDEDTKNALKLNFVFIGRIQCSFICLFLNYYVRINSIAHMQQKFSAQLSNYALVQQTKSFYLFSKRFIPYQISFLLAWTTLIESQEEWKKEHSEMLTKLMRFSDDYSPIGQVNLILHYANERWDETNYSRIVIKCKQKN